MSASSSSNLVERLADEYLERRRQGEAVPISKYCAEHPEVADELHGLLTTMELMEGFPSRAISASGSLTSQHQFDLDKIGDYRIVEEIGRGGMGVVYEAEHVSLGRRVALKVLPIAASKSQSARLRFEREARAAAKMHHTNIVPVFEVGNENSYFFYAMQLIQGQSLDRLTSELKNASSDFSKKSLVAPSISDLTVPIDSQSYLSSKHGSSSSLSGRNRLFHFIARIGLQAAEALEYSHTRGIVHRDVKPSNIILDESGVAWLTDFGLAKVEDEELTQTGDFVGTLRYMAPERFRGECDSRSDIYGLGLTLYELIAQEPAFRSSNRLELIEMIGRKSPIPVRARNPNVPRDLETIVMKAIEPEAKARYATAGHLAEDLRRYLNDQPIKARRQSVLERFIRWSRRNRGLAAALSLSAVLLLLIPVISVIYSFQQAELRELAEDRGARMQRNLYYSQMILAGQSAIESHGGETFRSQLQDWHPNQAGTDLRGWEWYYLHTFANQAQFVSRLQQGWIWQVDFSPDGSQFVDAVNARGIQVRDGVTGKVLRERKTGSVVTAEWSLDGTRIVSSDFHGDVTVWDSESLEPVLRIKGEFEQPGFVSWSPDSTRLAVSNEKSAVIRVFDAATGKMLAQINKDGKHVIRRLRWSPNNKWIAATQNNHTISVWDVENGETVTTFDNFGPIAITLCWSPDGSKLVSGGSVHVWDVESGKKIADLKQTNAHSVAWRPGHDQLLCGFSSGLVKLIDIDSGATVREYLGHTHSVRSVTWSKAGDRFVSGALDRTVRIWDARNGNNQFVSFEEGTIYSFEWNPDGTSIATTSLKQFNLWNPSTSERTIFDFADRIPDVTGSSKNRFYSLVVAYDALGDRIAAGGAMSHVVVWDSMNDEIRALEGESGRINEFCWSSDGRLATMTSPDINLIIWDSEGRRIGVLEKPHEGSECGIQWSPNCEFIYTGGTDNFIRKWDSSTLELVWEKEIDAVYPLNGTRLSHDGKLLASAHQGCIFIWDAATGDQLSKLDEISENFTSPDWSPDDSRLAVGSNSSVSVWDVEWNRVAIKFTGAARLVRWGPKGYRLAAARANQLHVWDARRGYEAERSITGSTDDPVND